MKNRKSFNSTNLVSSSVNRELLGIKNLFSICSSRLTLELTEIFELTFFVLLFFFLIPIFSQELSESKTKYPHIKELLVARLTDQAQREIDKLSVDVPNDPTLNYYQTEVWYTKGEQEYGFGNFKKALGYYEKAFEFWSGNPLLSERIKDVKEKLKNPPSLSLFGQNSNSAASTLNHTKNGSLSGLLNGKGEARNINLIILDKETQDSLKLQVSGMLEESYETEKYSNSVSISKPYLLFFSILGACLVLGNIISLTLLLRGKSEIKS